MGSSKLLLHESPLQVLPTLAIIVGLNEAIVLQQVHYWTEHIAKNQGRLPPDQRPNFRSGRWWTYQSFPEWQTNSFPFWSLATIKRTFLNLEALGVLVVRQLSRDRRDRTNWYSIDYDQLNQKIAEYEAAQLTVETPGEDGRCIGSNCTDGTAQDEPLPSAQDDPMLIKTYMKVEDEREDDPPTPPTSTDQPGSESASGDDKGSFEALLAALAEATGMDAALNRSRLGKESRRLLQAGYTAQQIQAAFGAKGAWYSLDWRGKKGERPTLANISEQIAAFTRAADETPADNDLERKRAQARQEMQAARQKRTAQNHPPAPSGDLG